MKKNTLLKNARLLDNDHGNVSYESDRDKTVLNILKHYHELKPEISGFGFYFSAKISHPKIKLCHFQP